MSESDKSGKQELRARYEVYMQLAGEDSRVVWDNQYERKLKPKEVVKILNAGCAAQARIAELEAISKALIKTLQVSLPIVSATLRETFEIAIAKAKDKLLKP